jgi:hypothetical protein
MALVGERARLKVQEFYHVALGGTTANGQAPMKHVRERSMLEIIKP